MLDQLLQTLDGLSVSPLDREAVEAFRKNPNGRGFLPIVDILTKHSHEDEALQLLILGVQLHPGYSAARVVLAQKLFERSIFGEAWQVLQQAPLDLRDNKTAQILRFRLALLLGYESKLHAIQEQMRSYGQLEGPILRLTEELEIKSFANVRLGFIQVAKAEGFDISSLEHSAGEELSSSEPFHAKPVKGSELAESSHSHDPVLIERLIDGFYVAPIHELFSQAPEADLPEEDHHSLDPATLAQIYRKQARYQKALDIYQKLLYMAPNNDLYKKQVEELTSLREEQKQREKTFDPELIDRLDKVQEIESKIGFLNTMLIRLDGYESK